MNDRNLKTPTPKEIDFLVNGAFAYFPDIAQQIFAKPNVDQEFLDESYPKEQKDRFTDILFKYTNTASPEVALKQIAQWAVEFERGSDIESTVPVNIAELVDSAGSTSEYQQARVRVGQRLDTSIEKLKTLKSDKKEIYFDTDEPEQKIILNDDQAEIVKLIHQNRYLFREELVKKLLEKAPSNTLPEVAKQEANNDANLFIAQALLIDNPESREVVIDNTFFETLTALADPDSTNVQQLFPTPEDAKTFSAAIQAIAVTRAADAAKTSNAIGSALGVDFSSFFIPTTIRKMEVKTQKSDETNAVAEVKNLISQVNASMQVQRQVYNQLLKGNPDVLNLPKKEKLELEEAISKVVKKQGRLTRAFNYLRFRRGLIPDKTKAPSAIQTSNLWLTNTWVEMGVPQIYSSMQTSLQTYSGVNAVGGFNSSFVSISPITNMVGEYGIKNLIKRTGLNKVATGLTTKVAAKLAATKIGAALATNVVPVVGQIVSAVSLLLSLKDIASLAKSLWTKHQDKLPYILGGILILSGAPAAGLVVMVIAAHAPIIAGAGAVLAFLTSTAVSLILVPLLILLVVMPIVVALILFIINTGAYIVPPSSIQATTPGQPLVSPYIKVTKVAEATQVNEPPPYPDKGKVDYKLEFENGHLPIKITYTVTIQALQGTLTNINISESCRVLKENSTPSCPPPIPGVPNSNNVPSIPPQTPYTFSYTRQFTTPTFEDTLTVDTVSVTADTAAQAGVAAAGSAIIIIGDPPEDCPSDWPISPEGSETTLTITQGPLASFSHSKVEAIDIAATVGHTVFTTHSGIVSRYDDQVTNNYGPSYVDVHSICGGVDFLSRYAHLASVNVTDGQLVTKGEVLGTTDHPAPHLHYEFRGLKMAPPWIPKAVPYGCSGNCGSVP